MKNQKSSNVGFIAIIIMLAICIACLTFSLFVSRKNTLDEEQRIETLLEEVNKNYERVDDLLLQAQERFEEVEKRSDTLDEREKELNQNENELDQREKELDPNN